MSTIPSSPSCCALFIHLSTVSRNGSSTSASFSRSRMRREASAGKQGGRTLEIQRLIGRSLRAVVDLDTLGLEEASLRREDRLIKLLLKHLVHVVDAQLLEGVGGEVLEAEDVEDTDDRGALGAARDVVDAVDDVVEERGVDHLRDMGEIWARYGGDEREMKGRCGSVGAAG